MVSKPCGSPTRGHAPLSSGRLETGPPRSGSRCRTLGPASPRRITPTSSSRSIPPRPTVSAWAWRSSAPSFARTAAPWGPRTSRGAGRASMSHCRRIRRGRDDGSVVVDDHPAHQAGGRLAPREGDVPYEPEELPGTDDVLAGVALLAIAGATPDAGDAVVRDLTAG